MLSFDIDRDGSEHKQMLAVVASALDILESCLASDKDRRRRTLLGEAQSDDMERPTIFLAAASYSLADVAWTPVLCRLEFSLHS